jgi:flagellar operon protein
MSDPIRLNLGGRINPSTPGVGNSTVGRGSAPENTDFAEALSKAQQLKFSNHAQKRLQARDINLTDEGLNRLANAVEKAEKRGGRESLVLMDDLAFIVNVKEHTVVTAMDTRNRGEGVFTQIDTVVFADSDQ